MKTLHTLHKLLHQTVALKFEAHQAHWNVSGPQFQSLHQVFRDVYQELESAIDEVAEEIRKSKFRGTDVEFSHFRVEDELDNLKSLAVDKETRSDEWFKGRSQVNHVNSLNEALISNLEKWIQDHDDDPVGQDFLIERCRAHKNHRYVLQSHLT